MLEKYKKEHHLTNKQLADILNLSEITVFRIIKHNKIGKKSIKAIANLLNIKEIDVYEYYKQKQLTTMFG